MLVVKFFGQFSIRFGENAIDIPSHPTRLLLIYLVLHPSIPVRRKMLAGLLWPESGESQARSNLRHALWRLRKIFKEVIETDIDYFHADDETVCFDSSTDCWIDIDVLEKEIETIGSIDGLIEVLDVYQGDLLPGFYEDWILWERDRLQAIFEGKMQALLERLANAGRWSDILVWGERWIALGGAPENAYRSLMVAHSHLDDLVSTGKVYQRCITAMQQVLGVEPSEETRDLYERIKEGEKPIPKGIQIIFEDTGKTPPVPGVPPYKGLQYFKQTEADLFFGREALTSRMVTQLASNLTKGEKYGRFLAVVGASGSGKSSLVRAGLIPAIQQTKALLDGTYPPTGSKGWPVFVIEPGTHPLEALVIQLTHDSEPIEVAAQLVDSMLAEPRSLHLYATRKLNQMNADGSGKTHDSHLVLIIDQFEELFTLCHNENEKEAFIQNLMTAVEMDGPIIVVIALRADFYTHCGRYPTLRQALEQHQVYIGPMSDEELYRAVTEPANRGNWEFEHGLVDFLLTEVKQEPGALPLLSHVLLETWKRRQGRTLTFSGYNQSGGLRGAIASTADRTLGKFDSQQQQAMYHIFLRLTKLGDGTPDTRRRLKFEELAGCAENEDILNTVLQKLADARLITIGENSVEVAHEALIREWPTLRRWLDENRQALQIHHHLTESAQAWQKMEKDTGELYRGARLVQAEEWSDVHGELMNSLEANFLDASLEFARHREAEQEALRQRELESACALATAEKQRAEEQAQTSKHFRRLAIWLGFLLVVAIGLGLLTLRQTNLAEEQTRVAKARELAAAALHNLDIDPEGSILLALWAVDQTLETDGYAIKEAEETLHQAVSTSRLRLTIATGESGKTQSQYVNFSPNGDRLVSWKLWHWPQKPQTCCVAWSSKELARVWDAKTGEPILSLPGYRGTTFWLEGERLATFIFKNTLDHKFHYINWDLTTEQELSTTIIDFPGGYPVQVMSDGNLSRILLLLENGMIKLFDISNGEEILSVGEQNYLPNYAAVFSPDSKQMAIGSSKGPAFIMDAQNGEIIWSLLGHSGIIYDMAYSADGELLATSNQDGTAIVWQANSGQALATFSGHSDEVLGVDISADGKYLATSSLDHKAIVWDLPASIHQGSGKVLIYLTGHTEAVLGVDISRDGEQLATVSWDGTIRVWDISPAGGSEGQVFVSADPIRSGWGTSIALNNDGTRLAIAATDLTPKIWDTTRGQLLHSLAGHQEKVPTLAYSPDGAYLVTRSFAPELNKFVLRSIGSRDVISNTIKIWDVVTGAEVASIPDGGQDVSDIAFSSDGKFLAVNNAYRDVNILDFPSLLDGGWSTPDLVIMTIPTLSEGLKPMGIEFSPDGGKIATSMGGNRAGIWDVNRNEKLHTLSGHESDVNSVTFNPDGDRVATASADNTARIWDVKTGECLHILNGHTGNVMKVIYSPDGARMATASMDGSAKLWDAITGKELLTLYGHNGGVTDVAFSPDGGLLYTAGMDGTVRVHLLDINDLIALALQRLTRNPKTEECQKYLQMEVCPQLFSK